MVRVIKQTEQRARNEYTCDLSEEAGEITWPKMTFTELRALAVYEKKGRKILKGEKYISQFNKFEGQVYHFKMDKSIFDIVCKYDLFPEY